MGASLPPLRIPITTSGDAAVLGTFNRIGQAGGALEKQFARSALNVAALGNAAVQAGEVGGSALTKLTNIGGSLALTLGIGGPVVAALGVAAITMVGFFDRARKEMEETRKKFEEEYRRIAKGGNFAEANRRATELFSGDPFAEGERERLGVRGLQARKDAILREMEAIRNSPEFKRQQELAANLPASSLVQGETLRMSRMLGPVRERLTQINAELAKIEPQQQRMHALAQQLAQTEAERVETAREIAKWQKETDPAKRQEAIAKEVAALVSLAKLSRLRGVDLEEMDRLERALTDELQRGNVARERRAAVESQLATLAQTRRDMFGTPGETGPSVDFVAGGLERRGKTPVVDIDLRVRKVTLTDLEQRLQEALDHARENVDFQFRTFGSSLTETLVGGLAEGIGRGDVGGAVLSALGGLFTRMGQSLIAFGATMIELLPALSNPFTSGPAALVAGAALVALGTAMGGIATGRDARGGGSFSPSVASATDSITNIRISTGAVDAATGLTPKQPLNVTLIGPNDPVAQRQLWELLDNGRTRGYGS